MIVGIDTETFPIGPLQIAPKIVCATLSAEDSVDLVGNGDPDFPQVIENLFASDVKHVYHNAKFDLGVFFFNFPHLRSAIFKKLDKLEITCTIIREKLINISTHGKLEKLTAPDGTTRQLSYRLLDLERKYLGVDRIEDKENADSWRMRFQELDGKKACEYPEEASDYAKVDALSAMHVHECQEEWAKNHNATLETEGYQTAVDFALFLMTCRGIRIDTALRDKIKEETEAELTSDKLNLLYEFGILRPEQLPRPHKNNPEKMTEYKPPSVSKTNLLALVMEVCDIHEIPLKKTKPSKKYPDGQVSCDSEVIETISFLHPALEQYEHRQRLQKIITTEIPRMSGEVVHPNFDVLKETTRTSSYASELYPSGNIQNVDPRVRPCYIPRDGFVFYSCDYASLELVTLAQKCYDLFGKSILKDKICAGYDPHAYLGSQLAFSLSPEFRGIAEELTTQGDVDGIYRLFLDTKKEAPDFYKHYRTFAKPVGLGYPGGLGPDTFRMIAKRDYGMVVDKELAITLRNIWFNTYPEMRAYFNWVQEQNDPMNEGKYVYMTPFGVKRVGCSFCSIANGAALQSPAAEGAKLAVWEVTRQSYDPEMNSILLGSYPLAFIHDEIMGETPEDEFSGKRACEVGRIMIDCMAKVVRDVPVKVEPKLMRRWSKDAQTVYDNLGNLIVWEEPKDE